MARLDNMGEKLSPHVAIIGGGCAGLATAARLSEAGIPNTLFEASPNLGGRARGLNWKGHRLDNGQHIMLGAYSETLALLKLASIDLDKAFLRQPLTLEMRGELLLEACSYLPAPLHLLAGLLTAKGLSWAERFAAIKLMTKLRLGNFKVAQDQPLAAWLLANHQPPRLSKLLWEPLCLAALNTPMDSASTKVFLNVLRDSLAQRKSDSDMLLPRLDLSELMAEPLANYIRQTGNNIKKNASINTLTAENDSFTLTFNGESQAFSHVVIATSPFRLAELMEEHADFNNSLLMTNSLEYQPIYTIYLQYDESKKLNAPMTGFASGYAQWVFDRGQLYGQLGLMAVIISAEGKHQALTQETLAETVNVELNAVWPELGAPLWHKVIAEKRATFACTPNLKRPDQKTAIKNLYLAGDYTAGDYPATIEGAIRSGTRCASLIKQSIQGNT